MNSSQIFRWLLLGLAIITPFKSAHGEDVTSLAELDLESLMQIDITSVSRRTESLFDATSAVYVITSEDIAASPATTIPQLLRQVPGLDVAQIDGNSWAVTARGFSSTFANKLLVMIDGRSVYTPLFSGVFWDSKDLILEDIERIEVIRGSGAVMWGANAVNGIVNIITKHSKDTLGGMASATYGNEDRGSGSLRYGARLSETTTARAYGRYRKTDGGTLYRSDTDSFDGVEDGRGGVRIDYTEGQNTLLISGEIFNGSPEFSTTEFTAFPPSARDISQRASFDGGHLLANWSRNLSNGDQLTAQFFWDRERRDDLIVRSTTDVLDSDLTYQLSPWGRHSVMVGANYRRILDEIGNTSTLSFERSSRDIDRASLFAQDEVTVVDDTFYLTLGGKIEYHEFIGYEPQPNVRARWQISPKQMVWAASSYAARLPSRSENDLTLVSGIAPTPEATTVFTVLGNNDVDSEHLTSFELGYRAEPARWLGLDLSTFYNRYRDVSRANPVTPQVVGLSGGLPTVIVPIQLDSGGEAEAYGVEIAAQLSLSDSVKLHLAGSFLDINYEYGPGGQEGTGGGRQGSDPRHQGHLRFTYTPSPSWIVSADLHYRDSLPAFNVDSQVDADAKLAYRFDDTVELSLNGTNLFNPTRLETVPQGLAGPTVSIDRSIWAGIRVNF